jgi:hypothetical protein
MAPEPHRAERLCRCQTAAPSERRRLPFVLCEDWEEVPMAESTARTARTDDSAAQDAAQNPLSKATETQASPRRDRLSWGVPVTGVVVALVVLALYVLFLA